MVFPEAYHAIVHPDVCSLVDVSWWDRSIVYTQRELSASCIGSRSESPTKQTLPVTSSICTVESHQDCSASLMPDALLHNRSGERDASYCTGDFQAMMVP